MLETAIDRDKGIELMIGSHCEQPAVRGAGPAHSLNLVYREFFGEGKGKPPWYGFVKQQIHSSQTSASPSRVAARRRLGSVKRRESQPRTRQGDHRLPSIPEACAQALSCRQTPALLRGSRGSWRRACRALSLACAAFRSVTPEMPHSTPPCARKAGSTSRTTTFHPRVLASLSARMRTGDSPPHSRGSVKASRHDQRYPSQQYGLTRQGTGKAALGPPRRPASGTKPSSGHRLEGGSVRNERWLGCDWAADIAVRHGRGTAEAVARRRASPLRTGTKGRARGLPITQKLWLNKNDGKCSQ